MVDQNALKQAKHKAPRRAATLNLGSAFIKSTNDVIRLP